MDIHMLCGESESSIRFPELGHNSFGVWLAKRQKP